MRFKGPLGSFFLREDSDKPIIMVASGTGFAPIKGIIEHAIHHGITRPIVFYWGARTPHDLYMAEQAGQWQAQNANITFIPVVSDALPEHNWLGRSGFVHQAVLDDFDDLSGYQVYACGAPIMVEAAHKSFIAERKLPEDEFFSDAFFLSKDMSGSKP
ncbi:CDP-6-deoxy-L-threo-D-glycero-4-hexulose-3-dehydrase reductase [compost metagenome]